MQLPVNLTVALILSCFCQVGFAQAADQNITSQTQNDLSALDVSGTLGDGSATENLDDEIEYGVGLSGEQELRLLQLDQSTLLDYTEDPSDEEFPAEISGGIDNWYEIEWEEVELLEVLENSSAAVTVTDTASGSIEVFIVGGQATSVSGAVVSGTFSVDFNSLDTRVGISNVLGLGDLPEGVVVDILDLEKGLELPDGVILHVIGHGDEPLGGFSMGVTGSGAGTIELVGPDGALEAPLDLREVIEFSEDTAQPLQRLELWQEVFDSDLLPENLDLL